MLTSIVKLRNSDKPGFCEFKPVAEKHLCPASTVTIVIRIGCCSEVVIYFLCSFLS